MTLRRTMAYQIAALIVGSLLIGLASVWGLNGLHQDYDLAARGYGTLRQLYLVSSHVVTAKALLAANPADHVHAIEEVRSAAYQFGESFNLEKPGAAASNELIGGSADTERAIYADLREVALRLSEPIGGPGDSPDRLSAPEQLTRALGHLRDLDTGIRHAIDEKEQAAEDRRHATMLAIAILAGGVVISAALVGIRQYRSVASPLQKLSEGVRTFAPGSMGARVSVEGHSEFVSLAADFNRMASELDGLYRDLEQKVAIKSRELVRSERLASVGYLAAGVAHEINNPLGIITGHAELSLQRLTDARDSAADPETRKTLEVICEEAFRCKEIVQKLLSLARSGDEQRRPLDLRGVAADVVATLTGLKQYEGKKLTLAPPAATSGDTVVLGNDGELKQVTLNLLINALDAVMRDAGEVKIDVRREGERVELRVADNGRGMDTQTLERIFEPFFTDRRGRAQAGTGLGLSITHAIVTAHQGEIRATSDGPGAGSEFVVSLPIFNETRA